jgi:hypothetical protein
MNVVLNPSELSQTTYTGRNKANFETISYSLQNYATGSRNEQEYTITCSADNKWGSCRFDVNNLGLKFNTTYTFSALIKSTTSTTGSYMYVYGGATDTGNSFSGSKATAGNRAYVTFTTPSSWGSSATIGLAPSEAGATTVFTNVMIEESSTMGEYEPYVGGMPSPNPLYPQPIKKVTGNNNLKVCGKNLWGGLLTSFGRSGSGIDFVNNADGTINVSGTATGTIASTTNSLITTNNWYITLPAGTYTLSGGLSSGIRAQVYKKDDTSAYLANDTGSGDTFTLTETTDVYARAYIINGTVVPTNTILKPQIEVGSIATTYQPYQGQTYPINLGTLEYCKIGNYSDKFALSTGKNLINSIEYNHGVNTSGTITGTNTQYLGIEDYVAVKPNTTYTITFEHDIGGELNVGYKDQNGTFISRNKIGNTRTFTTPSNAYYAFCYLYLSEGYSTIGGYTQLEEGPIATPYQPYGIGNWYLKKNIGTFSDSSELTSNTIAETYIGMLTPALNIASELGAQALGNRSICNVIVPYDTSENRVAWFNGTSSSKKIRLYCSKSLGISTYQNMRDLLNGMIIYYVLETPTYTQITDTTLISQLNNLYTYITSYLGQTNITQTNAELPFNIDASALYDLNNLISRVATLEVEV